MSHIEYKWVNGAETLECYVPGGYHPVMIGDILHDRYHIVNKLGFGGYSTVWLARDARLQRYVAVKVGIAESKGNSLLPEIQSLQALASTSSPTASQQNPGRHSVPQVLDEFKVQGPNGTHICYTTLPARCNLQEVSFSRLFPLDVARALCGGLTLAVAHIHSLGYVHGDIHLRNILVKLPSSFDRLSIEQLYEKYGHPDIAAVERRDGESLPPNVPREVVVPAYFGKHAKEFNLSDVRILLSDFGEAFSPSLNTRPGKKCNIPLAFRAPEAIFEPHAPLLFSADVWSLATAIWEIIGMKAVFSTDWVPEDEMISQWIEELGPLPISWWERWEKREDFFLNEDGLPTEGRYVWPPLDQAFEEGVQAFRRDDNMGVFSREETAALLKLMRQMLSYRPEERPTAEEILRSDWMLKWVLPDFERSLQTQGES